MFSYIKKKGRDNNNRTPKPKCRTPDKPGL